MLFPIRNELYPGLNRDYSILDLADSIKALNNNGTFQYMMDANSRRHWGGIFEAPTSYRLISCDMFLLNLLFVGEIASPLFKRLYVVVREDGKGKYTPYNSNIVKWKYIKEVADCKQKKSW